MNDEDSVVKHYLDHENGTLRDVKQGENWFNLSYGLFFEPLEEISDISGHTGVCFEVDKDFIAVKIYPPKTYSTSIVLERNGNSEQVPILKMRVLEHGDVIHVDSDHPWWGIATKMTLTYRREVVRGGSQGGSKQDEE